MLYRNCLLQLQHGDCKRSRINNIFDTAHCKRNKETRNKEQETRNVKEQHPKKNEDWLWRAIAVKKTEIVNLAPEHAETREGVHCFGRTTIYPGRWNLHPSKKVPDPGRWIYHLTKWIHQKTGRNGHPAKRIVEMKRWNPHLRAARRHSGRWILHLTKWIHQKTTVNVHLRADSLHLRGVNVQKRRWNDQKTKWIR